MMTVKVAQGINRISKKANSKNRKVIQKVRGRKTAVPAKKIPPAVMAKAKVSDHRMKKVRVSLLPWRVRLPQARPRT